MRIFSYRNKRLARNALIVLGIVLALALIFLIGRLIYLQRFLVYGEDGVRLDYQQNLQTQGITDTRPDPEAFPVQMVKPDESLAVSGPIDDTPKQMSGYYVTTSMMQNLGKVTEAVEKLEAMPHYMLFEMKSGNVPSIIHPERGDTYSLGDILFTALTPIGTSIDGNDASLVIKLSFGEASFLFTGDISEDVERELIDDYPNGELDCDFLKIAHHGSNTSTSAEFIAAVTPSLASISCGEYNDFGHPRHEVLNRLRDGGCEEIYRTDKMSSIILKCDGKVITLVATRDGNSE